MAVSAVSTKWEPGKEGRLMKRWKPVLAHGVTVVVTLVLVMVFVGGRLGLRRPPLARIPGGSVRPDAPSPGPAPAPANAGANQVPPPPEDVLESLDPDPRNNVQVYGAINRAVVNITTEAEGLGFFVDET